MLKLLPPGTRKGNGFWLIRGRYHGRLVEISTRTPNRVQARKILHRLESDLAAESGLATAGYAAAPPGARLFLVPPGTRKGDPFWLVRGRLADGRHIEFSTKTGDRTRAAMIAHEVAASSACPDIAKPRK
jgi:hypothetical protein